MASADEFESHVASEYDWDPDARSCRSGSCCPTLGVPGWAFVGESGYCLSREWERPRESGEGPTSGACLTGCTPDDAPITWCTGLALVRASSEARLVLLAGMAAVQHGSTATHPDAGGRAGTREDDDLHGWTRVDVLPPDGMQEVSGSSPLSSTWSTI
jgi:hypothetical protein